jgi:hypothetical protein
MDTTEKAVPHFWIWNVQKWLWCRKHAQRESRPLTACAIDHRHPAGSTGIQTLQIYIIYAHIRLYYQLASIKDWKVAIRTRLHTVSTCVLCAVAFWIGIFTFQRSLISLLWWQWCLIIATVNNLITITINAQVTSRVRIWIETGYWLEGRGLIPGPGKVFLFSTASHQMATGG